MSGNHILIMSSLRNAFRLQINSENKEFVTHPYQPKPTIIYPFRPNESDVPVLPQPMTIARCFDIKYGSKNCFSPIYKNYNSNFC
jgi:hypothetical protein